MANNAIRAEPTGILLATLRKFSKLLVFIRQLASRGSEFVADLADNCVDSVRRHVDVLQQSQRINNSSSALLTGPVNAERSSLEENRSAPGTKTLYQHQCQRKSPAHPLSLRLSPRTLSHGVENLLDWWAHRFALKSNSMTPNESIMSGCT